MIINDNMLTGIWKHLQPDLARILEALHMLLDKLGTKLYEYLLSMEKCYGSMHT